MQERLAFNRSGPRAVSALLTGWRPARPVSVPENPPRPATTEPRDWSFVGLLLFTLVVFVRPQDHFLPLRVINVAEIAAAIAAGGLFLERSVRGRPLIRVTPEVVGVTALAAWAAATMPFSIWPGGVFTELTSLYLKVVVIFVLMASVLTTPRRIDELAWLITLSVGYIATRGVLDYARGVNLVEGNRLAGAVGGILRNPNDLALNLVTFLPLAIFTVIDRQRPLRRLVAGFAAVMMLAAIVFTKSRGGMIGLVVMLGVTLLHGRRIRPGMTAALVIALICSVPLLPSSFVTRMASIFNEELDQTGSREARQDLFKEAFVAFVDHPITGVGAGQFVNYDPENRDQPWRAAHNVLLQIAAELGVVGLCLFVFLVVRAAQAVRSVRRLPGARLRRAGRLVRAGPGAPSEEARRMALMSAALGATLAGWFVCAMFAPVAFNWTFYYVLALCASLRDVAHERLNVRLKPDATTVASGFSRTDRAWPSGFPPAPRLGRGLAGARGAEAGSWTSVLPFGKA